LPIGVSFLAIFLELFLPNERHALMPLGIPVASESPERHYVA